MKALKRPTILVAALAAVVFIAFVVWYRRAEPLAAAEVERYIAAVRAQPASSRGSLDLTALRRFYEADDGRPFFNVNLFEFKQRASYPEQAPSSDASGAEAFDRYSAFMLRTLPGYASHIAFAGRGSGASAWDLIAVVRYRSRRDFARLHASGAFAEHAVHKWAALERYEHYPVSSPAYLSSPYPLLLLVLSFLVFVTYRIERWARVRASRGAASS